MGNTTQATAIRNMERIVQGTVVNSTSGTSIDFTGIPSWAKKITILFNGVSTNGSSPIRFQLGSTSFQTTGYLGGVSNTLNANATNGSSFSSGFDFANGGSATLLYGVLNLYNLSSSSYVASAIFGQTTSANGSNQFGGSVTLSGVLDRIRITTVNGTDTFDAGQINIMYEG